MKWLILFLPLLTLFIGCDDSFVGKTYTSLKTMEVIYNVVMTESSTAHRLGFIKEDDKNLLIEKGNKFYVLYLDSVENLSMYANGLYEQNSTDIILGPTIEKDELAISIYYSSKALNDLINTYTEVIKPYKDNFKQIPTYKDSFLKE